MTKATALIHPILHDPDTTLAPADPEAVRTCNEISDQKEVRNGREHAQTLAGNGEMIEIAFLACSLLQGGECMEVELRFYSQASPSIFECALYGQAAMAKWVVKNPNWSVARGYRCGPPSKIVKL